MVDDILAVVEEGFDYDPSLAIHDARPELEMAILDSYQTQAAIERKFRIIAGSLSGIAYSLLDKVRGNGATIPDLLGRQQRNAEQMIFYGDESTMFLRDELTSLDEFAGQLIDRQEQIAEAEQRAKELLPKKREEYRAVRKQLRATKPYDTEHFALRRQERRLRRELRKLQWAAHAIAHVKQSTGVAESSIDTTIDKTEANMVNRMLLVHDARLMRQLIGKSQATYNELVGGKQAVVALGTTLNGLGSVVMKLQNYLDTSDREVRRLVQGGYLPRVGTIQ